MARNGKATNDVDEVLPYLEGVAKNLVDRLYGPAGPAWGTHFNELEETVGAIRKVLTERMLHQALERQAAQAERPPEYNVCPGCGRPATAAASPEPRRLDTGDGEARWQEPKTRCDTCRRDFFPRSKSLGIDRGRYGPRLRRKIVYAGAAHGSFEQGQQSLKELADVEVSAKRVERLTRAIGGGRVAERTAAAKAFRALPPVDKHRTPTDVPSPDVAVIEVDGGRPRIRECGAKSVAAAEDERPEASSGREKGKHWREDKAALPLGVQSEVAAVDPCPRIPETFVDPTRILKLAREIHAVSAGQDGVAEPQPETGAAEEASSPQTRYVPPAIRTRQVVASRVRWPDLAPLVAQAARMTGLLGAVRRAFVGDGSDNNWAIWRRFFGSWTAIIDFIHVLSYVFAAATAGRKFAAARPVVPCARIEWLWQGQPERVIVEVAQRQVELLAPLEAADGETGPRRLVAEALTYLQNHQDKMRYDAYRWQGLPLTGSHYGVANETDQPAGERHGEVLVRRGGRSDSATACRLTQRRLPARRLLGS